MPAENVAAFSTQFFDLKIHACRQMLLGKWNHRLEHDRLSRRQRKRLEESLNKISSLRGRQIIKNPFMRDLSAKYETKGKYALSRNLINTHWRGIHEDVEGAAKKFRQNIRYIKWFLRTLEENQGEIFFFGYDKRRFKAQDWIDPHIKLISPVLEKAFDYAQRKNTTLSIFLDRHSTDRSIEIDKLTGNRVRFTEQKSKSARTYTKLGRIATASEVIFARKDFENITEPVIALQSSSSQCTQAADWVGYLLSQTLPFKCKHAYWQDYEIYHNAIEDALFSQISTQSEFGFIGGKSFGFNLQGELPLDSDDPPPRSVRPTRRPYHHTP